MLLETANTIEEKHCQNYNYSPMTTTCSRSFPRTPSNWTKNSVFSLRDASCSPWLLSLRMLSICRRRPAGLCETTVNHSTVQYSTLLHSPLQNHLLMHGTVDRSPHLSYHQSTHVPITSLLMCTVQLSHFLRGDNVRLHSTVLYCKAQNPCLIPIPCTGKTDSVPASPHQ